MTLNAFIVSFLVILIELTCLFMIKCIINVIIIISGRRSVFFFHHMPSLFVCLFVSIYFSLSYFIFVFVLFFTQAPGQTCLTCKVP